MKKDQKKTVLMWEPEISIEALFTAENGQAFGTILERRSLLKLLGIAGIAGVLNPLASARLMANPLLGAALFRTLIIRLVTATLSAVAAELVVEKIRAARIRSNTAGNDFHAQNAAKYNVDLTTPTYPTRFNNGSYLTIQQKPRMDSENPTRIIKDLNEQEIRRITYEDEIEQYGCVPFPCSERIKPCDCDQEHMAQVAAGCYGMNPARLQLEYVRAFNDGRKAFTGYGVSGRYDRKFKDVLLGPV